jgi:hypothetical protein
MLTINNISKKLSNYRNKKKFFKYSRNINPILKKITKEKIHILDLGAGNRYLKSIINFDGISKIALVDPSQNLEISSKNLMQKVKDKKAIKIFNFAISNKNGKSNFYPAKISTGSSLINFHKLIEGKKLKDSSIDKYFGKIKEKLIQTYSYKRFKSKFKWKGTDILKIDIEGYESKIIKDLLKNDRPLIIQIELNFFSSLYGDSFNFVHNFLSRKGYKIISLIPSFENDKKEFIKGDFENPIFRNQVVQAECFYINFNQKFSIKNIITLFGFGFIDHAYKMYTQNKKYIKSRDIKKHILKLFSLFYKF